MAKAKIDTDLILITPLVKGMTSGVFPKEDGEFTNLINWWNTGALLAQREKKSKTYTATYEGKTIAYVTISMSSLTNIEGSKGKTGHDFPVLLVGKLYTHPDYRSNGVGRILMGFILDIAQNIDTMIGCVGLLVDANSNKQTVKFYTDYGFVPLDENKDGRTVQMFFKLTEEAVIA